MEDEPKTRIDNPEQLCDTIVEIVDVLEESKAIGEEQASELRSKIYRSIDTNKE